MKVHENARKHILWNVNSFGFKLFITFFLIIVLALGTVCGFIYNYMTDTLRNQVIRDEKKSLEQIADHISYIQDTVQMTAQSIAISNEIQNMIRNDEDNTVFKSLVTQKDMRTLLSSYVMMQPYFVDILIVAADGTTYSSNNTEGKFDAADEVWYLEWKKKKAAHGYSKIHMYNIEQGQASNAVISYICSFRNLKNVRTIMGDIIINIDINKMINSNSLANRGQQYALFNNWGNRVFGSELSAEYEEMANSEEDRLNLEDENVILINRELGDEWFLAAQVSGKYIASQVRPILRICFYFLLLTVIIMSVVIEFAVHYFMKPIRKLVDAANKVAEGNYKVHVNITTKDELSVLGNAFNNMVVNIDSLLQKSIAYEKKNKEIEINRLMLQINPHFIYNTLNSIVYMARMHRDEDIIRFTNAFISLLQDTLQVDEDNIFIPLRQEIKNIKNYIEIQSLRYPGIIRTVYDYSEDLLDCAVPNVFIQPIVENAIYHGIAAKPEGGTLTIIIFRENDNLRITVKDDGV